MLTLNENLTVFFVGMYNKEKDSLNFLIEGSVPKLILLTSYKNLVTDNYLTPIEQLPQEEKIALVNECNTTQIKFTNATRIDAAKILHTIKFINQNI